MQTAWSCPVRSACAPSARTFSSVLPDRNQTIPINLLKHFLRDGLHILVHHSRNLSYRQSILTKEHSEETCRWGNALISIRNTTDSGSPSRCRTAHGFFRSHSRSETFGRIREIRANYTRRIRAKQTGELHWELREIGRMRHSPTIPSGPVRARHT